MKKRAKNKRKLNLAEKIEVISLILFIFSLFLLDVNANLIGAYGNETNVNLINGKTIRATTMFWLGFLGSLICLLALGTRRSYNKDRKRKVLDYFFLILGIIGLMIILSGGILLQAKNRQVS